MADTTSAVPPALTQLLAQSVQRQQYQNPLFQAVTNQAFAGLPVYARQGLSLGSSLPPIDPSLLQSGGGGGADMSKILKALAAGMAGAKLGSGSGSGGGNLAKAIADALKKLFGGSQFHQSAPGQPLLPGNPYDPFADVGTGFQPPDSPSSSPQLTPSVTTSDEMTGFGQDAPSGPWSDVPGQTSLPPYDPGGDYGGGDYGGGDY